jgi:ketosteroid isomerase-like protein
MAESNVDLVRRGFFEAFANGGVDALLPFVHPEFEVTTPAELAAEPDTYRGPEGIRRYFDSFYDAMDEIRFEAEDYIEVGERVVVPFRLSARGRSSGLEFDQRAVQVWEARDGLGYRLEVYPDLDQAIAAAEAASSGDE